MHPSDPTVPYTGYSVWEWSEPVALHEPPPDAPTVPEALVQDLWAHQRFRTDDLATTEDEAVHVLHPGSLNTDAGPDFQNAHVRIGSVDWRGPVEIHNTSGGWFEHGHHTDPRYDSVVLHVTLHPDMWTGGLLRSDESPLPEIVLYPHLETPLRELLRTFHTRSDEDTLPCAPRWDEVPTPRRDRWIEHLAERRLKRKRNRLPNPSRVPVDVILHERLLTGLGYSKNDDAMATLARRVSPQSLRRLSSARDREALLLGLAGLLPEPGELLEADRETADYAMDLRDRFRRIRVEIDAQPMASTAWTFFRLRPNNFPPLRLAQAAAWYTDGALLAEDAVATLLRAFESDTPIAALREALAARPRPFWHTHYHLKKSAGEHDPSLGRSRIDTLIVNAVAPVILLAARRRDDSELSRSVYEALRNLPPSRDHVTRRFADLGTSPSSAFEAQGLHELYRQLCTEGGCLDCEIGQYLLSKSRT